VVVVIRCARPVRRRPSGRGVGRRVGGHHGGRGAPLEAIASTPVANQPLLRACLRRGGSAARGLQDPDVAVAADRDRRRGQRRHRGCNRPPRRIGLSGSADAHRDLQRDRQRRRCSAPRTTSALPGPVAARSHGELYASGRMRKGGARRPGRGLTVVTVLGRAVRACEGKMALEERRDILRARVVRSNHRAQASAAPQASPTRRRAGRPVLRDAVSRRSSREAHDQYANDAEQARSERPWLG